MKIIVEGHLVETKEIWDIIESDSGTHGFIIRLIGYDLFIGENKNSSSWNFDLKAKNDRYRALREKVKEKWNQDKTEIEIFKL